MSTLIKPAMGEQPDASDGGSEGGDAEADT